MLPLYLAASALSPYRWPHPPASQGPPPATSATQTELRGPEGLGVLNHHVQPCPMNTLCVQAVLSESSESQWAKSVCPGCSEAMGEGRPVVRAYRLSLGPEGSEGVRQRKRTGDGDLEDTALLFTPPHPAPCCPLYRVTGLVVQEGTKSLLKTHTDRLKTQTLRDEIVCKSHLHWNLDQWIFM